MKVYFKHSQFVGYCYSNPIRNWDLRIQYLTMYTPDYGISLRVKML